MFRLLVALLLAASCLRGAPVPLRVCTFNVEANFQANFGIGEPGTVDYDSVLAVLQRIDADVICLQEIHVRDTQSQNGATPRLNSLGSDLGLSHIFVPSAGIDTSLRVVFLSRYPFANTDEVTTISGARDVTRNHPVITVDVPGTDEDPTFIGVHGKSGFAEDDRFRRAIELIRIDRYLTAQGFTSADPLMILGDFNLIQNLSNQVFTQLPPQNGPGESDPNKLPRSYVLGNDFTFPITYFAAGADYFSAQSLTAIDARALNGNDATFGNSSTIDLLLVSPGITDLPVSSEIYRSALDTSNSQGLAKSGNPLPSSTSTDASDHWAIFADIQLGADLPELGLTINAPTITEGATAAAALTVSLPAPVATAVTVEISAQSGSDLVITPSSITIAAGQISAQASVFAPLDFAFDGPQATQLTASATGYDPALGTITTSDVDTSLTDLVNGFAVVDFDYFSGSDSPAPFADVSSSLSWSGVISPTATGPQRGSLARGSDRALAVIVGESTYSTSARFRNTTGQTLTSLEISYQVDQFFGTANSTADIVTVELLPPIGAAIPLPDLTFTAGSSSSLQTLSTTATGLNFGPNAQFLLRFTITPAGVVSSSDDVFVNELHYDNSSSDTGEFIEIVTAPGFAANLSSITLSLYNGSNGTVYDTHTLDTFTLGSTTSSGHSIYFKAISGIQNGAPDGFSLSQSSTLIDFLSYEGTLTATNGPASGQTSIELPVNQGSAAPAGEQSLALTGTGDSSEDFTWARPDAAFTAGQANPGQSFAASATRPGIAIDDITIITAVDTDRDGTSDYLESTLTLTDPLDGNSRFSATPSTDDTTLDISTIASRTYVLETSTNLLEASWTPLATHSAVTNGSHSFAIPAPNNQETTRFYRVAVSR